MDKLINRLYLEENGLIFEIPGPLTDTEIKSAEEEIGKLIPIKKEK